MVSVKNILKQIVRSNYLLFTICKWMTDRCLDVKYLGGVKFINKSPLARCCKFVRGYNNTVNIGKGCRLYKTLFRIVGNNNIIEIGDNVSIAPGGSIWTEGNNCRIKISDNCSFRGSLQIIAQEDNSQIFIGNDCMFSNHIIVQTSDSHAIYEVASMSRTNPAKNISIGNHVWVGPGCRILRGTIIGDNSIIGSGSIVTKEIPNNVTAVGVPAKVVREGITWSREALW